jgi:hypothetical protein
MNNAPFAKFEIVTVAKDVPASILAVGEVVEVQTVVKDLGVWCVYVKNHKTGRAQWMPADALTK